MYWILCGTGSQWRDWSKGGILWVLLLLRHSSESNEGYNYMDRESRQTRKERGGVVEAWQNEWGDQCYCSLGKKTLRDTSESAKLVATGSGGLINAGFHGRIVCCRGERRGCWRSESETTIVMPKAVDGQRVGLCYRHAEGCWRSESGTVLSSC